MDISTFKIGSLFRFFLQITKTTINILLLLQNFSKWMSIQRDQILYKVSKALEIRFCAIFQRQIQLVNNTYWHQIRANCIPDMFFLFLSKSIYAGEPRQPFVPLQSDGWALWDQEKYQQKYFLHHRDQYLSSSISSTTEINIWVQIFPPLQKSTSEFKFSPNLYKINCTWSMESFYVGSVTDTFSSDFEWFFLTITGQICIKYKKLSIKTKLTDIDKGRNWWFDFWQYISCDKCDVQLMKTDQLKCWIANQLKSSAGQLLNCWAPDQMHKTTGHQLKKGPWCSLTNMWYYSTLILYFHPTRTFTSYIFIYWDMPHNTFYHWNKVCTVLPKKTCWSCAVTKSWYENMEM